MTIKKLIAGISSTVGYLAVTASAFAQDRTVSLCPDPKAGGSGDFNALCNVTFGGNLIGTVITLIFIVAIVIALFYLIWGGIKWLLSGGDKGKVDAARSHIVAAIVGLVIIFLSYFILSVVVPFFVPNFSFQDVTIPTL